MVAENVKAVRTLRVLRFAIIGLIVLTLVLLAVSLYTLFMGLTGAVGGDTFKLSVKIDEATGAILFRLDGNPRNGGLLSIKITFEVAVLSLEGQYVARNSTAVYIEPGARKPLTLTLFISQEDVQRYNLQELRGSFEYKFGITTLWDLVGILQVVKIKGGGEGGGGT